VHPTLLEGGAPRSEQSEASSTDPDSKLLHSRSLTPTVVQTSTSSSPGGAWASTGGATATAWTRSNAAAAPPATVRRVLLAVDLVIPIDLVLCPRRLDLLT